MSGEEPVNATLYKQYSKNFRKGVESVYHEGGGEELKANVSRFAAYKAYQATRLARRERVNKTTGEVIDQKDTAKRTLAQFQAWQTSEYNTTVARARTAKQWNLYTQPNRQRLFPNIKWLPSMSVERRPEHVEFYNRIWAKDDPFWASNTPGTLWNCKCGMQETDEGSTDNAAVPGFTPPRGLEGNPGITGEIFTERASYFQVPDGVDKICNRVVFKDNKAWAMENLKGSSVKPKDFKEEIHFSGGGIDEYLNQPHDDYYVKNEMIRTMPEILKGAEYMGESEYKGKPSHIFKVEIRKKTNYVIVKKQDDGKNYFYSVTDSDKVLINIKK